MKKYLFDISGLIIIVINVFFVLSLSDGLIEKFRYFSPEANIRQNRELKLPGRKFVTPFNFQLLDEADWTPEQDIELDPLVFRADCHYSKKMYFIPSLDETFLPHLISGRLYLAQDLKGYVPGNNFTYTTLPKDAFLEFHLIGSEKNGIVIRFSAFGPLISGIYASRNEHLTPITLFSDSHPLPADRWLDFEITLTDDSCTIFVDSIGQLTSTFEKSPRTISLLSGQWPLRIDDLSISGVLHGDSEDRATEIHKIIEYQSRRNPIDDEGLEKRITTREHEPSTLFRFIPPLLWLIIFIFFILLFKGRWVLSSFAATFFLLPLCISTPKGVENVEQSFSFALILSFFLVTLLYIVITEGRIDFTRVEASRKIIFRNVIVFCVPLLLCNLYMLYFSFSLYGLFLSSLFFFLSLAFYYTFQMRLTGKYGIISFILFVILVVNAEFMASEFLGFQYQTGEEPAKLQKKSHVWPDFKNRIDKVSPEKQPDTVRIVCFGGSSTFGFPFKDPDYVYPAVLEKRLKERYPYRKFEVLNGGINGFTSFLIQKAFEQKFFDYHPDIITVNCWFNDSTQEPRWYSSYPQLTDREAWNRINMLAGNTAISRIHAIVNKSYFYHSLKSLLLQRKSKGRPNSPGSRLPRGTIAEFRENISRIITDGEKYGIKVLLIPEPYQYCGPLENEMDRNPYIKTLSELAMKHDVPLVDLFGPLSSRGDDFLYVDYIHPSILGHQVIGHTLSHKLETLDWF